MAKAIPNGDTTLRSVFDAPNADYLSPVTVLPPNMDRQRFRDCLDQAHKTDAEISQILGATHAVYDDTHINLASINRYIDHLKTKTLQITSTELMFLSEVYDRPICLFTHHSLGETKFTAERTCIQSRKQPIYVAVSEGKYERWQLSDPYIRPSATRYSPAHANPIATTRKTASVLAEGTAPTRTPGTHFGTAFTGNTAITCWLEAYLYATAYGPDSPLQTLTTISQVLLDPSQIPPTVRDALTQWKTANPERANALIMLSQFLQTMTRNPNGTLDITTLDQTLQRAFFKEDWRQQDATEFQAMVMGTIAEIIKATHGEEPIRPSFMMNRQSRTVGRQARSLPTAEMQFMGHESLEFRINLHHETRALAGTALSTYLIAQDAATTVKEFKLPGGNKVTITKGQREFEGTPPQTCQLQMMSAKNNYSFQAPAAHTAAPDDADTDAPSITIPVQHFGFATQSGIIHAKYLIEQIIVRSGSGADAGHYTCYFKQGDGVVSQDKQRQPCHKVAGGFPVIHADLVSGGKTYTYYGKLEGRSATIEDLFFRKNLHKMLQKSFQKSLYKLLHKSLHSQDPGPEPPLSDREALHQ